MYDAKSDTRAVARTASLNEELGEIQQVFCDKTGSVASITLSATTRAVYLYPAPYP